MLLAKMEQFLAVAVGAMRQVVLLGQARLRFPAGHAQTFIIQLLAEVVRLVTLLTQLCRVFWGSQLLDLVELGVRRDQ
jgi:hypothetical protein